MKGYEKVNLFSILGIGKKLDFIEKKQSNPNLLNDLLFD